MSIPVEREDQEVVKRWGLGLEKTLEVCVFCRIGTPFWHRATNRPVCEYCAGRHDIAEIPVRGSASGMSTSRDEATA
jgi:hypothetical protein